MHITHSVVVMTYYSIYDVYIVMEGDEGMSMGKGSKQTGNGGSIINRLGEGR